MSSTLSQSSTIIRTALFLESAANIGAAIFILVLPHSSLSALGITSPSVLSKQLIMYFAGCIIALTVPLVLSMPNKPGIVAVRRVTYATMLGGEIALSFIMVAQGLGWSGYGGNSGKKDMSGTMRELKILVAGEGTDGGGHDYVKGNRLVLAVGNLVVLAVWRVVCMYVRPEWMGIEGGTEKKGQ